MEQRDQGQRTGLQPLGAPPARLRPRARLRGGWGHPIPNPTTGWISEAEGSWSLAESDSCPLAQSELGGSSGLALIG